MSIKNFRVSILCPIYHRMIDITVICAKIDNKYEPISCNGCDFGYNASDECEECITKALKDLKEKVSNP